MKDREYWTNKQRIQKNGATIPPLLRHAHLHDMYTDCENFVIFRIVKVYVSVSVLFNLCP